MKRRILHMDSDIPSIYLPVGDISAGGTCEFSTDRCKENCPSGMLVSKHEKYALDFFKTEDVMTIVTKIKEDFDYIVNRPCNDTKMIQWFAWGDCLSILTDKVATVILSIRNLGIPQYGFTRNHHLWEIVPIEDRLRIGLSVDNLKKALDMSTEKMIAHSDFKHGYAEMIFKGKIRSRCNGWQCMTELENRISDCNRCLIHGEGCYFKD